MQRCAVIADVSGCSVPEQTVPKACMQSRNACPIMRAHCVRHAARLVQHGSWPSTAEAATATRCGGCTSTGCGPHRQVSVLQAVAAPPQRDAPPADSAAGGTHKYCESTWQTRRRPTRTVEVRRTAPRSAMVVGLAPCPGMTSVKANMHSLDRALLQIGPVKVGSEHKIALQTMTTTDTREVEATVDQVLMICTSLGHIFTRRCAAHVCTATACTCFYRSCSVRLCCWGTTTAARLAVAGAGQAAAVGDRPESWHCDRCNQIAAHFAACSGISSMAGPDVPRSSHARR